MPPFVVPGKRSQTVHHKRLEGTPVYLNERQRSGAGDNDLNVAEGRNLAGIERSACTREIVERTSLFNLSRGWERQAGKGVDTLGLR